MVLVYLVQHGEAVPEEVDPRRPLTDRGRVEVERVAAFLFSAGVKPSVIYHSGKLRAKQTAEILASKLQPSKGVREADGLEPKADPKLWAERLNAIDEDVMIVGHLPHLARLASMLLTGNPDREVVGFRYGAVFCLERSEKGWRLLWGIRPYLLPS